MNNKKLTILISFFVASHIMVYGQNPERIIGLYGICEDGYLACQQMNLKADSSFEHYLFYDVGGGAVSTGTWHIMSDTLVLNTFKQPKQYKLFNIDSTGFDSELLTIRVYDADSNPLPFASLKINETIEIACNENGQIRIENIELKSIVVSYVTRYDTIMFDSLKINEISFFVPLHLESHPQYLVDMKWLIKRNKLYPFLVHHRRYDRKYYLKKTDIKNKRF